MRASLGLGLFRLTNVQSSTLSTTMLRIITLLSLVASVSAGFTEARTGIAFPDKLGGKPLSRLGVRYDPLVTITTSPAAAAVVPFETHAHKHNRHKLIPTAPSPPHTTTTTTT